MKYIIATSLLLSVNFVNVAQAQSETQTHVQATEQKQALKALIAQYDDMTANFSFTVVDEDKHTLQQGAGFFQLKKPSKLKWQQQTPDNTLLVSNGDKTYFYDDFAEQVTILNSSELIKNTPFILLTTDNDALWQNYNVEKTTTGFLLTPVESLKQQIERLALTFNNEQLVGMAISDVSGQTSVYQFNNTKVNQKLDDVLFNFTIPDGVMVDDQSQSE